jgi:hypothetical protein
MRLSERDSSGTTEHTARSGGGEGDGADSPTQAANAHKCAHKCQRHAVEAHAVEAFASEAARPNP